MAHRVSSRAEADLDEIWLYVAEESGSTHTADHLIDTITQRFLLLATFPYVGRLHEQELGVGRRSWPVGEYAIVYCVEGEDVLILRVVHGRRQLPALFE